MIRRTRDAAFTLIELLVSVTIIVILIALLVPALDIVQTEALKTKCLSNTRTVVQNCLLYTQDNQSTFPAFQFPGGQPSSAYDMRPFPAPAEGPMATGLLVKVGLLPSGPQLGKLVHCPIMDNTGDPSYSGVCMDRAHGAGGGGSYWTQMPNSRIIAGYNYRAASFFNSTRPDKPRGILKSFHAGSGFLVYIDVTDVRFASTRYGHPDGYNRAFGDGSGGWFSDPDEYIRNEVMIRTNASGVQDGLETYANDEEDMYDYMSQRSVAEKP